MDLKNLEKEGEQWKIDKKKQEIAKLENGIRIYKNELDLIKKTVGFYHIIKKYNCIWLKKFLSEKHRASGK